VCGFSKGSCVLNHFVAEIAALRCCTDNATPLPDWEDPAVVGSLPVYEIPQRIASLRCPAKHLLTSKEVAFAFLDRVRAFHWLDAHRFPTHPESIKQFAGYCAQRASSTRPLQVCLHGTPRQLQDKRRLYIRKEYDRFQTLLTEALGGEQQAKEIVSASMYFETQQRQTASSMSMHFRVLDEFFLLSKKPL